MGQFIRLVIIGFIIQFVGMASFMSIAQSGDEPGKQISLGLVFIATFIVLVVAVYRLNLIKLVLLAVLLAVSFTSAWCLLGLTLFPGLLMKMPPFSVQPLRGFASLLVLTFGGYMVCIFGFWIIRKLQKIFVPDHVISSFWLRFRELWDIW